MAQTDLDIDHLRKVFDGRLVGGDILYYERLCSTMDEVRRLADEDRPEGTVVFADEQTAGRGRFLREWVSPPGQNLTFSVLLRPSSRQLRHVNMATTLAVSWAVECATGVAPRIKWPNDVRVNGLKISGVLTESVTGAGEVKYAIVGVGINVNLDPTRFPEIAPIATSIRQITGAKGDRTTVLRHTLERLDDLYHAIKRGESLTDLWAGQLDTLGKTVQVRWEGQVVEGEARAVDEEGNLVVVRHDGSTVTVVAGEVTLQV